MAVIVRLTTRGQNSSVVEPVGCAQNQGSVETYPTPFRLAAAAIAASVWSWTPVPFAVQVFIVAPDASRQSTGSRVWFGSSPTTITLAEYRLSATLSAPIGFTAAGGS